MSTSRRDFLKTATALSLGGASSFGLDLARFNAFAADTSGYKALVCIFMFGGMDGHDTVIPFDTTNYNQFANIREALFDEYENLPGGSTRARDRLLPLNLGNAGSFSGRQFALPEELQPLHELIDQGNGAIVSNVGPLVAPMNRTQFENGTVPRPPRLFSHNDQQSVWMSSQPEGASFGWGGRIADMALASSANSNSTFTAVSAAGNSVFLSGEIVGQYEVGRNGPDEIRGVGDNELYGSSALPDLLEAHLRAEGDSLPNILRRDFVNVVDRSIDANRTLRESFQTAAPFSTVFPSTGLAKQLQVVAQTISLRNTLGVGRQVFFVSMGGFDSHSNQANSLPSRHAELAGGMRAFYDAMTELGINNDVTAFTASDFGRTLTVNRDGTDHGWGGHHFVIGGGVDGNRMLGDFPEPVLGHDLDTNNGRLIPSTSVDQYAATLGRWFGLNDSELVDALPGLTNFSNRDIGLFSGGTT